MINTHLFCSDNLITGTEVAAEHSIDANILLRLLKSFEINAYRSIVSPTPSNKNNVPPGLPGSPQRYSRIEDDEIQEMDIRGVRSLLFEWNQIKVFIPKQEEHTKNNEHREASKGQKTHRTNTRRQLYNAAASRAVIVIQDLIHYNMLPVTREQKLNQLKCDKDFQEIIAALPKGLRQSTLIRRLADSTK